MGFATHTPKEEGKNGIVGINNGVSSDPRHLQNSDQKITESRLLTCEHNGYHPKKKGEKFVTGQNTVATKGLHELIDNPFKPHQLSYDEWKKRLIHPTSDMISKYTPPKIGFSSGHVNGYKSGGKSKRRDNKISLYSDKVKIEASNWSITSGMVPNTKMGSVNNKPYKVLQESEIGSVLTVSNTVPTFGAIGFTLTLLDQLSNFTNIFDQYRIGLIEAWIVPQYANSNQQITNWASVEDYDDATVLTTFAQALDYTNVETTPLANGHYRRFVPHIAVAAYSGAFTSFANEPAPWIDCSSSAVAHYGIKLAALASGAGGSLVMNVRLHVSFRNVR